jgi:hypothetical protein
MYVYSKQSTVQNDMTGLDLVYVFIITAPILSSLYMRKRMQYLNFRISPV